MKPLYKTKSNMGANCSDCGKYCPNPYWITFEDVDGNIVEGPYGSNCAKKYKIEKKLRRKEKENPRTNYIINPYRNTRFN